MACNTLLILGVGRSGTTALYSSLQDCFYNVYDKSVRCVYEPFLWNWPTFDKPYADARLDFTTVNSLSYEGIHENKLIPLFLSKEDAIKYKDRPFIKDITTRPKDRKALLSKMIRANGRYHLLRAASPEAKIIFIIRNPMDVVNSSSQMFSFYGEDFHQSDFERFQTEVHSLYGETELELPANTYIQKQARYWYFMNRHFLEQSKNDQNVLLIKYEDFKKNPDVVKKQIANFIDIPSFADRRLDSESPASKIIGPSYAKPSLSQKDLADMQPYIRLYNELLSSYFENSHFSMSMLGSKYLTENLSPISIEDMYLGKSPLILKDIIRRQHDQIIDLQRKVAEKDSVEHALSKFIKGRLYKRLVKKFDKLKRKVRRILTNSR